MSFLTIGGPIFLINTMAIHTQNLQMAPRTRLVRDEGPPWLNFRSVHLVGTDVLQLSGRLAGDVKESSFASRRRRISARSTTSAPFMMKCSMPDPCRSTFCTRGSRSGSPIRRQEALRSTSAWQSSELNGNSEEGKDFRKEASWILRSIPSTGDDFLLLNSEVSPELQAVFSLVAKAANG